MKQIVHYFSNGSTELIDSPVPALLPHQLLIRTSRSLISPGTERMLVEFGKSSLLEKARQQPDRVKDVLNKAKSDGVLPTIDSIKSKLDTPIPLGYCNVGEVVKVGNDVTGFKEGDRVVSNGSHSEFVAVSHRLCALIPDNVDYDTAAFTILASIGLQGIRLASPTFGETLVVSGLGLIGLLASQLLIAQGCRVLGLDIDPKRCSLAESFGVTVFDLSSGADPVKWCLDQSLGVGVDGVLITASSKSSKPVDVAAEICRKRGRIVLVGVVGLKLRRDLFYKKELSFQVSCSYGPGRYDTAYEEGGIDYPIGFVRWTEQRNLEAVLRAFSIGVLNVKSLISSRFSIYDALVAYADLTENPNSLSILLEYPSGSNSDFNRRTIALSGDSSVESLGFSEMPCLGVVGAGNYASRVLIPAFRSARARFRTIVTSKGLGSAYFGARFGFVKASTDVQSVISDPLCNVVVIATRHNTHSSLVCQALSSGKHVFVEKPLCLTLDELASIESVHNGARLLMVGYNRRFAPLLLELKLQLSRLSGPKAFVYTCNAGAIPTDHWTQDPVLGGGRLLGEACHFVDLLRYLAASPIEDLQVLSAVDSKPRPDTFSIQLRFVDGSIGTVHYFATGSKSFPKERLEVFAAGKVLRLDNYRKLQAWGIPGFSTRRLLSQDKGQQACCAAFLKAIEAGGPPPIPVEELFEVQRWLLKAVNQ